jgi:hypothetical protein
VENIGLRTANHPLTLAVEMLSRCYLSPEQMLTKMAVSLEVSHYDSWGLRPQNPELTAQRQRGPSGTSQYQHRDHCVHLIERHPHDRNGIDLRDLEADHLQIEVELQFANSIGAQSGIFYSIFSRISLFVAFVSRYIRPHPQCVDRRTIRVSQR